MLLKPKNLNSNKMSVKESIRLRQRKMATGNISLYLDMYRNGVRQYEYLKLYLIPEKTRADKDKNRQTLQLAEAIKAKRIVELHNNEYGFTNKRSKARFFAIAESLIYKDEVGNERSPATSGVWQCALKHLHAYEKRDITFEEINTHWVEGFRTYLDNKITKMKSGATTLSQNTKWLYFAKLVAIMNYAKRKGIITHSPCANVRNVKKEEVERAYLTLDELKQLAQTPCAYPNVRRAFLFSCLTGLRISDVQMMKWADVQRLGDYTRITFKQKKTKGLEYLDVTPQAVELMGERKADDESVFSGLPINRGFINSVIKIWVAQAGIRKDISYHCSRHTFAVMMLDIGTDIYTVSKLLGHRELATTQVYARILDKNKQKAVANIPNVLG